MGPTAEIEVVSTVPPIVERGAELDSRRLVLRGALVLLQVLFLAVAAGRSFYSGDDLLNFALAREMGLGWDFLTRPIFGHWAPLHRFADWAVIRPTSLSWPLGLAIMVAFAAIGLVFLDRLLLAVGVRERLRVALLVVYAMSPLMVRSVSWFAAAMHVVPGTACVLVCLDGFVRFRDERRARSLVQLTLGFGVGLLFYEIPLLLIGLLALLAIALLPERLSMRGIAREIKRLWPVWAILVPIALAYLWNYETNVAYALPHPGKRTLLEYFWMAWAHGFVPGSMGVALDAFDGWQTFLLVVAQVLLAAAVVAALVRSRRAWRIWALAAFVFLVNGFLVGWNRAALFGADLGKDLRYQLIVLPFFLLAVGLSWSGSTGPEVSVGSLDDPGRRAAIGLGTATIAGVLALGIFAGFAIRSGVWIADHSEGEAVRPYLERASASLARARSRGSTLDVFDADVPFDVVSSAYAPYNRVSEILPLVDTSASIQFEGTRRPKFAVDSNGTLRRASFTDVQTAALAENTCAVPNGAVNSVAGSFSPAATADTWTIRLVFRSGAAARFNVAALGPAGTFDLTPVPRRLPSGATEYWLTAFEVPFEQLRVDVLSGGPLCVTSMEIGKPGTR